jgi:hypothetical protein
MQAVGPEGFVKLSDEQLTLIARRFRASYIVIPPRRRRPELNEVYRNGHYAVYTLPTGGAVALTPDPSAPAAPAPRRADAR